MDRWRGRVALVTGASVGIGAAIARSLVSQGMKVVGCARDVDKVQALADELSDQPGSLLAIRCDLRKEGDIMAIFEDIRKQYGGVDVWINNAALSYKDTSLLSGLTENWRDMLEVNVLAVTICTRESYKSMKERGVGDGHIVLLNSLAGHRVGFMPFYAATKCAVTALTEGIRNELRQTNTHIRVTYLKASDIADVATYILGIPPHVHVHDVIVRHTDMIEIQRSQ